MRQTAVSGCWRMHFAPTVRELRQTWTSNPGKICHHQARLVPGTNRYCGGKSRALPTYSVIDRRHALSPMNRVACQVFDGTYTTSPSLAMNGCWPSNE